jgi:post-segregation antitoxin (ccd killing protein)
MSQVLTLELSDEVYAALQQQAKILGIDLSELVTTSLERQYRLTKIKTNARKRKKKQHVNAFERTLAQLAAIRQEQIMKALMLT